MEDINERLVEIEKSISKLETKIEEHDKLLQKQQDRNETQTELNTILKMNVEQMKKITETLDRMDVNLTNLNSKQEQFSGRLSDVEATLSEQTISTNQIFKGFLKQFGLGLATIIVAYLLFRWGISGGIQK